MNQADMITSGKKLIEDSILHTIGTVVNWILYVGHIILEQTCLMDSF